VQVILLVDVLDCTAPVQSPHKGDCYEKVFMYVSWFIPV